MSDISTIVLESQLDWITAGTHSPARTRHMLRIAQEWAHVEKCHFNEVKPWSLLGYIGAMCGRVRFGTRGDMGLIQLSGDLAREHFAEVYAAADSISRLDVAITIQTPVYDGEMAMRAYAQSLDWRETHPRAALPSLVQDADGGSTCYVGKRDSDRYLRIYNKQAECESRGDSEHANRYARAWRIELETKANSSTTLAASYSASVDTANWCNGVLRDYFLRHGLCAEWPPDAEPMHISGLRRRSDYDSKMAWLNSYVRPTVKWCLANGDRQQVISALGFDLGDLH